MNLKMISLSRDKYFGGLEPNHKNCRNCGARYSCNIQHKKNSSRHSQKGADCRGLVNFKTYPKID